MVNLPKMPEGREETATKAARATVDKRKKDECKARQNKHLRAVQATRAVGRSPPETPSLESNDEDDSGPDEQESLTARAERKRAAEPIADTAPKRARTSAEPTPTSVAPATCFAEAQAAAQSTVAQDTKNQAGPQPTITLSPEALTTP